MLHTHTHAHMHADTVLTGISQVNRISRFTFPLESQYQDPFIIAIVIVIVIIIIIIIIITNTPILVTLYRN